MSDIHDTQYLCPVTSLISCIAHPIPSSFPYLIIGETATLVDWSRSIPEICDHYPCVLPRDLTELQAKCYHNRSKTVTRVR